MVPVSTRRSKRDPSELGTPDCLRSTGSVRLIDSSSVQPVLLGFDWMLLQQLIRVNCIPASPGGIPDMVL